MYRLEILQSRRTNNVLTHVKLILCGRVLDIYPYLSHMTSEDMTKELHSYISDRATSRANAEPISISHFRSYNPTSCHITSNTPRGTTYENIILSTWGAHGAMVNLYLFMLHKEDTHITSLSLESTFAPWGIDFLPPRESKTRPTYPLSCGFLLSPFAQESHPGASQSWVYLCNTL